MAVPDSPFFHRFGCGVLLFDRQGLLTFANEKARRILNLTDRDLGQAAHPHPWRTLSAEGRPLLADEHPFTRILRGETLFGEEFRVELAPGNSRVLALNGAPLLDPAGEIEGGVVDFNDVTEKSRAQAALATSEERLRALIGSIDEIVFEFDAEGTYINIWTANDDLLLRPRQELLGRRVDEVFGEEAGRCFREMMNRVLATGKPETFEYPLEVLGGKHWFLARIAPIPAAGGSHPTLSFLARDITQRKLMENELRASESRFHEVLETIQLTAVILDRRGIILFCNEAIENLTGWNKTELEGRDWFEIFYPPEDRQTFRARWMAAVCSGPRSGYHEEPIHTRTGEQRLIGWNTIVIRDRTGNPVRCASIGEDITERQRAEEVLRRSDQMKSEFISTAAHELRTPLTTILGYSEILLNPGNFGGFTPEQQREFLQEIYDKGQVLARIINDLLDLSRIEAGQPIPLELGSCTLDEILVREVRNYQIKFPDHCFSLTLADACPAPVRIDRHKMEQVLENLLSNAVKYSPAGSLVRVSGRREDEGYLVAVGDEGVGMSPEQVARVFEKFYRADFSDTAAGGLGLGMSIAKGIVEAHGGEIWVESAPGRGTTVSFRLPVRDPGPRGEDAGLDSAGL